MKLDRLLGILTILLQNDNVTAPYLAKRFEVTRRTIGRDIDALCRAGIPVVTKQGSGGGILIADGYKLDKSVLTVDELTDILAALKGIGSVSEKSRIERMLDKLSAGAAVVSLREPIIIDLASHSKNQLTETIGLIKRAVLETRLIEFDYISEKGETHRRVEPYFVIFQWSAWYAFGFCTNRQDWRLFRLTRILNLELCAESFSPREIPLEKRDFGASFPDDKTLVAVFDSSVRHQLLEANALDWQTEANGDIRLKVGYTNTDFILSWLLSFGSKVKVLEPEEVVAKIRTEAENILSRYK